MTRELILTTTTRGTLSFLYAEAAFQIENWQGRIKDLEMNGLEDAVSRYIYQNDAGILPFTKISMGNGPAYYVLQTRAEISAAVRSAENVGDLRFLPSMRQRFNEAKDAVLANARSSLNLYYTPVPSPQYIGDNAKQKIRAHISRIKDINLPVGQPPALVAVA